MLSRQTFVIGRATQPGLVAKGDQGGVDFHIRIMQSRDRLLATYLTRIRRLPHVLFMSLLNSVIGRACVGSRRGAMKNS